MTLCDILQIVYGTFGPGGQRLRHGKKSNYVVQLYYSGCTNDPTLTYAGPAHGTVANASLPALRVFQVEKKEEIVLENVVKDAYVSQSDEFEPRSVF